VIGVVGSDAKARVAKEAGAEIVLVRGVDDIARREGRHGHGADIFDPVGGDAFDVSSQRRVRGRSSSSASRAGGSRQWPSAMSW
jgi:NADPH:quinone reductase-like Zn-dependent oxidoreductase